MTPDPVETRVLILAPVGQDATLISQILTQAAFNCCVCADGQTFIKTARSGAGALLLTAEAARPALLAPLTELLESQPSWSDLPLILLSGHHAEQHLQRPTWTIGTGRNVTILKRPLQTSILITVVSSALRARRRQYQVRDLVQRLEQQNDALSREIEERRRIENELQQTQQKLEERVQKRTASLATANTALMEEIAHRKTAEQHLRRRNRELSLLNQLTSNISDTFELDSILELLRSALAETLNLPGGCIFLITPAYEELVLMQSWGLPDSFVKHIGRQTPDDERLQTLIRDKRPLLSQQLETAPFLDEDSLRHAREIWQSLLYVPLLSKENVLGFLCLFADSPDLFDDTQIQFFQTIGREVGTAIHNVRLYEKVRISRERLRHLAHQVFSAQEKERHRIARELHDEAGQALTGLKITLEMTRSDLPDTEDGATAAIRSQLDSAIALCEQTMAQIRNLAHALRPAALENLGLHMTLQAFCRDFGARTNLTIQYEGAPTPTLPDAVEICLYRFLQEALTNVVRHADATRAEVTLHSDENTVSLAVEDNGVGFDAQSVLRDTSQTGGIGIAGMQGRIESVDGRLLIQSNPNGGTRLVAWIPL